jgi:hypothetical protein
MQPLIGTMTVSTQAVAEMLNVPSQTFSTWRKRNNLLDRCHSARGFPAAFTFADALAAYVAKRLIGEGFSANTACRAANNQNTLTDFMNGVPTRFYVRDGDVLRGGANPEEDISVSVPLERIGWEFAEFFALSLAAHKGPESGRVAMVEFSKAIEEHREQV